MNDIFSTSRFMLFAKKYAKEHLTTYLLYIAMVIGILLLVYGLSVMSSLHGRFSQDDPVAYFYVGSIFVGSLFSASFFNFFQNKAKGVQYLNLPASQTEKLVLSFIFTQVIFYSIFTGAFYLVDQLMCSIYNNFHTIPAKIPIQERALFVAKPFDFSDSVAKTGLIVGLVVSSIQHFGSLVFEKNAFVKTSLIILVAGGILINANFYSMRSLIPEEIMPGGFFFTRNFRLGLDGAPRGFVYLPPSFDTFICWFMPGILYVLFWVSSYFKLKEKQI